MAVSLGDKEHMRKVGRFKAESHGAAQSKHQLTPLSERLSRSWDLYVSMREHVSGALRQDDPSGFYVRARELRLLSRR